MPDAYRDDLGARQPYFVPCDGSKNGVGHELRIGMASRAGRSLFFFSGQIVRAQPLREGQNMEQTKANIEHEARGVITTTIQSTLLLFFTLFPLMFMYTLIHEGAHALSGLSHGEVIRLFYAHPFSMNGYVNPNQLFALTVWGYASGHVLPFLISLPLFVFLWRRRSVAILPFIMLFPWAGSHSLMTVSALAQRIDDFNYVISMSGWPAWPFFTIFLILAVVGIFLFVSTFPLLGIKPKEKRTFFVIPVGFLLWNFVSIIVAYLIVPGSRADVQFHMREKIISSATNGISVGLFYGVLFALVYFTLYRVIERRLPACLRTEKINLAWRDLLIPGILSVISIVVGILIIR
jgi:hypothetical protein